MDDDRTEQSELRSILHALWRRKFLIGLCTLLAACTAVAYSLAQEKQYSATATLLFRDPGFDQTVFGGQVFENPDPTREAATNVDLVSLQAVADRTARRLGNGLTGSQLSSKVDVEGQGQSNLVSATATDHEPAVAARLANTFAHAFVAFRRDADRDKIADARGRVQDDYDRLDPVAKAGQQGQALQSQISKLSTLEALQTGNAEVVQGADVPTSPSSPKTVRNGILAGALGFILGLGLAFLLQRLDRRLRNTEELEEAFSLPLLGTVPDSKALANSKNGKPAALPFAEAESFRMVRTRLRYFNVDRAVRSILVTSSVPREGKSTVARHLAITAATGGKVILVEADFHQQTVAAALGLQPLPGLAEVLTKQCPFHDAVQPLPAEQGSNGQSQVNRLDVLVAGATPPNPGELLESDEMARLVGELSERYELVVIDTPPVSVLADAIPVMKLVSGVIVVGELDRTTRDDAVRLGDELRKLDAPVLGVVANRVGKRRRSGYGYQYYYGGDGGASRPSVGTQG